MVEIARPSTAVKYLSALPRELEGQDHDDRREEAGEQVDRRSACRSAWRSAPNQRGAAPSKPATACERSAPMIHVVPLESSARMKPIAARSPSTLPAPVSVAVTVPSAAVVDVPAVDREDGLHGVEEAAEAGDLRGRQHEQDRQDRHAVEQHGAERRAEDGERHVLLRVLHLVARGVGQLEADVVEEQHRHGGDEDRPGRA